MEELNVVQAQNEANDTQAQTVDVQNTVDNKPAEQQKVSEQVENAEVVAPQEEKPVQTPEENSAYKEQRKRIELAENRAKQLEQDYNISKTYGTYGVHSAAEIQEKYNMTFEQFENAVREQEMREKGLDPNEISKYVEEHPDVKAARELKQKLEQQDKQQVEYNEFLEMFPDAKPSDIPHEVWHKNAEGTPLKYAYMEYQFKQQKEQAQIQNKNIENAAASTGSVNTNGEITDGYISFEVFEKNKTDQTWVKKNFNKIMESRTKW